MPFIINAKEAKPGDLGGKGAALAALHDVEVTIPLWFAVTPGAFMDSVSENKQGSSTVPPQAEVDEHFWSGLTLSAGVSDQLRAALHTLCPNGESVAVRSSAADEDGEAHSFAGQFDSFLFVAHEDVAARVLDVWRSAFSETLRAYRLEHGLSAQSGIPTVLVQRMVNAEVSGVAFGADPVNGDPDIATIASVYGLAIALVSGECDGDTHRVNRDGEIVSSVIATKTTAHRAPSTGSNGTQSVPVDTAQSKQSALTDEQVRRVAELVRRLEVRFGCPQDIEWAICGEALYLLQSRPITTKSTANESDVGVLNVWDNSNIIESYNGVTSPLTFSFASYVYEQVYGQFCRVLRVPEKRIEKNADVFRNMLGLIQGRIYYNLLNWYRTLALLPGFQANRGFMEQMMGVKGTIPDELLPDNAAPTWWARAWDNLTLLRSTGALVGHHLRLGRTITSFYKRLDTALSVSREELDSYSPEELIACYADVERQLLKRWDAPLINDFLAMIFFGLLGGLSEKWLGRRSLANDLLRGQDGIISVEPARRLAHMAQRIAKDDTLIQLLCQGSVAEIQKGLADAPSLREDFDEYLTLFGDRCLEELKLESPTLHDDPHLMFRSVGQLAKGLRDRPADPKRAGQKDEVCMLAERVIAERLGSALIRRVVFNFVLRHARNRIRDRENLRFARTRLFGSVRHLFLTFGRRFYEVGAIEAPEDVFYLERLEIFAFVEGRATTVDLKGLVEVRKREFNAYRKASPPNDRLMTRGMIGAASIVREEPTRHEEYSNESREGIGCSAGVVSGTARVILDPRNEQLESGEILVAKSTDPGWILLFSAASGLLIERGSLLSHSAIVAREMGIPCVVSIPGVTDWIKTGDTVEFDGSSGWVRRLTDMESG